MVNDPYSTLGVSRDASMEEIKKAYRKKAKEHHPDLHPNDPKAAEKMNEINEAYDMLSNPEKYKGREQSTSSYGGFGGRESGRTSRNPYGNADPWGNGQYREFNFDDLFGFNRNTQTIPKPTVMATDSEHIKRVVEYICRDQYEQANNILNIILSAYRDARWHYLSAIVNYGMGNQIRAMEQIQIAVRMDSSNALYKEIYDIINQNSRVYRNYGGHYEDFTGGLERCCCTLCQMQMFCMLCNGYCC